MTATCRVCKTRQRLADDGRVTSHADPRVPFVECDGAGRLPTEAAMQS